MAILILDFYVDEPSCLGVPPFLSPYVRYTAGALVAAGISPHEVEYLTVDQWRKDGKELKNDPELVILIAGHTVPGRYLGGKIGTMAEVVEFLRFRKERQKGSFTLVGGPLRHAPQEIRDRIHDLSGYFVEGDVELFAEKVASHPAGLRRGMEQLVAYHPALKEQRTYEDVDRYAQRGAFISTLHPRYPGVIIELESYRGCTRTPFCSFCTEALYGKARFRSIDGIEKEVGELSRLGIAHFRLGRQADLLTYWPDYSNIIGGFPAPDPEVIQRLYDSIHRAAPHIRMLHLDNVNPGTIANHPALAESVLKIIASNNTPGDTAAMGMESADPAVIEANHLKATPDQILVAVQIANKIGSVRKEGVPALLPGLNLLQGLPGESDKTFRMNFELLMQMKDMGLLLRRTNIRRVHVYDRTALANRTSGKKNISHRLEERFLYYKERIREEIDRPMLQRIYPAGTIIKDVYIEAENETHYLGRPLGSYPVTLKFPRSDKKAAAAATNGNPVDTIITGWESRSMKALTLPIEINTLDEVALRSIPGLGKKRAVDLLLARPIQDIAQLRAFFAEGLFCEESMISFG